MNMMQVNKGPGNSSDCNSVQDVQFGPSLRTDIGAVSTNQTRLAY